MAQPLWKTVWRLLKKFKIELLYDSSIPILGIQAYLVDVPSNPDHHKKENITIK